jgi:uncharacterized protein
MPEIEPPYKREERRGGYGAIYEQRQWRPPQPKATYGLLGTIAGFYVLEVFVAATYGEDLFALVFTIRDGWWLHPWQLVTSTLSHGSIQHLFFNGLFLYFFGPTVENVLGRRNYLIFFFATGALSGVLQVHLPQVLTTLTEYDFGAGRGALGASGALFGLFGINVMLTPKARMIVFPIFVPIPMWVAGVGFVILDLLGVFNPGDRVGNFAHLSGLAIGLWAGFRAKESLRRRGLRLVTS